MSRCGTTGRLLDAVFAEIDLTRDQAEHVATCAECARALSLLRRFGADLESIGRDLATERVGSVHELTRVSVPEEGSTMPWRNGFIGVAAVAVVVLAITVASQLAGRPLGEEVGRVLGLGLDRSEAARAFGIPDHAVVIVGDDAVGLRVADAEDSASFELLLMDAEEREVRQVYEHRIDVPPNSGGIFTQPVRCFGVLERDIFAVIGMGWPGSRENADVSGVSGDIAAFAVRGQSPDGRVAVLFVADADEVDDESIFHLRIGTGVEGGASTGPLGNPRGAVDCAQPATATCGEWANWEAGTRASLTQWLTETRLDAVRVAQQLPADAPEAETVNAAAASIDKNCQGSPAGMRLTDIVERLYD